MDIADNSAPGSASGSGNWQSIMGVAVVCGFATIWAWMGAGALHHGSVVVRAAVILISVTLLVGRMLTIGRGRYRPVDRRLLRFTIAGEIIALWIMGAALGHWNQPGLLLPGLAIIVGLHFFPMARAVGISAYNVTASAMTVAGIGSLAVTEPSRTALLGLGCAIILWLTIAQPFWAGRRRRAKVSEIS
jgi:hypothetical protein